MAQVLVDRGGVARFIHYGHSMSDIPRNEEILGLVVSIDEESGESHHPWCVVCC